MKRSGVVECGNPVPDTSRLQYRGMVLDALVRAAYHYQPVISQLLYSSSIFLLSHIYFLAQNHSKPFCQYY